MVEAVRVALTTKHEGTSSQRDAQKAANRGGTPGSTWSSELLAQASSELLLSVHPTSNEAWTNSAGNGKASWNVEMRLESVRAWRANKVTHARERQASQIETQASLLDAVGSHKVSNDSRLTLI